MNEREAFTYLKREHRLNRLLVYLAFGFCILIFAALTQVFGVWYGIGAMAVAVIALNVVYGFLTGRWLEFWR